MSRNPAEARKWLELAAKQGMPEALYDLGEIYYFGDRGEPKDPARALAYFQQSAATDYAPAQNALGVMFRDGHRRPA